MGGRRPRLPLADLHQSAAATRAETAGHTEQTAPLTNHAVAAIRTAGSIEIIKTLVRKDAAQTDKGA